MIMRRTLASGNRTGNEILHHGIERISANRSYQPTPGAIFKAVQDQEDIVDQVHLRSSIDSLLALCSPGVRNSLCSFLFKHASLSSK